MHSDQTNRQEPSTQPGPFSNGSVIPVQTEEAVAAQAEMQERANIYTALGALLGQPADQLLLETLESIEVPAEPESTMEMAWAVLREAATGHTVAAVDDEYHDLFIGVGRGQVVQYGSWHLTGFLMEKPLGKLRADLRRLGFERRADVHESEDHIASLCQVMAALIMSQDVGFTTQKQFFNEHLAPWAETFFVELQGAPAASFYRAVGNLGQRFLAVEKQYLSMPV